MFLVSTASSPSVPLCSPTLPCWHRRLDFPWSPPSVRYTPHQCLLRQDWKDWKPLTEISLFTIQLYLLKVVPCRRRWSFQPWLAGWRTDLLWPQADTKATLWRSQLEMKVEAPWQVLHHVPVNNQLICSHIENIFCLCDHGAVVSNTYLLVFTPGKGL